MAKSVALTDVILELHVSDFDKVKDFYGKLGFKKVWEYPAKGQSGYLVIKRKDSILCFFCGNEEVYNHPYFKKFPKTTVKGYGVEIAIYLSDVKDVKIDDYYQQVIKTIGKDCIVEPLKLKPWGSKDFRIIDPFGYYLCFREPSNILHA